MADVNLYAASGPVGVQVGSSVSNQVQDLWNLLEPANASLIDSTSTIVLAIATALVLLMVPGLAFFYSGLLRKKNALTMLAQVFVSAAIVTVIWVTFGFGAVFGPDIKGIIGDASQYLVFRNIVMDNNWNTALYVNTTLAAGVPFILFFLYQLSFAIITPTLVAGGFADRLKWRGYIIFNILFTLFIYIPVAHQLWGGGMLQQWGGLDWAGGIVIHITCAFAAIGSVIVLRKRKILLKETNNPHNIPLVAVGAALLFFGWFGFNGGGSSYIAAGNVAETGGYITGTITNGLIQATNISNLISSLKSNFMTVGIESFVNTFFGMSIGMLCWLILESIFKVGKVSLVGLLTGSIAGLATITPAAGFITIPFSIPLVALGSIVCYICARFNHKIHFDDALEVWPVHGIGSIVGAIAFPLVVLSTANPVALGALHQNLGEAFNSTTMLGHDWVIKPDADITTIQVGLIVMQAIAVSVVMVWTLGISLLMFTIILFIVRGKLNENEQIEGADKVIHNEEAYGSEISLKNILSSTVEDNASFKKTLEYDTISKTIEKELKKEFA